MICKFLLSFPSHSGSLTKNLIKNQQEIAWKIIGQWYSASVYVTFENISFPINAIEEISDKRYQQQLLWLLTQYDGCLRKEIILERKWTFFIPYSFEYWDCIEIWKFRLTSQNSLELISNQIKFMNITHSITYCIWKV